MLTLPSSLFHVVVDSDETASTILEVMNRERSGRVTFVPLNRIKPKAVNFQEKTDAILMIKKIAFEAPFKLAMQQVFARTVICPSLAVASSYVKSHDVNAITLDGDRVERKGAMTGGFHDLKRSRLDAVRDVARWEEVFASESKRLQDMQREIAELDQRITALASERQQLKNKSQRVASSRKAILDEVHSLREAEASGRARLQKLQLLQDQLERESSASTVKKIALQEEMRMPLQRGLTSAEAAQLKSLTVAADEQEKQVAEMVGSVNGLSNKRQILEIELNDNFKRERDAIVGQLELMDESSGFSQEVDGDSVQSLVGRKKELAAVKRQLNQRHKALDRLEKVVEEMEGQVRTTKDSLEQVIREQADEARKIEKQDKTINKIMARTRELTQRKEDAERKIRELGVVPGEAYNKHTALSAEKIFKELHKINTALKKFSNVNKRAVEQYDGFTKQRDQLLNRQDDLEKSSASIEELIETLDMRKDEAIERTFKQVSKNFADIFEKLVPMGRGMLVMQKKMDADDAMELDDDDDEARKSSIENYTGVSIKVSFNSKVDEGLRIQQLSGGQKSLVALAIVFAIQKCDPAAFYLFDEIDANLDAQYRTAVAAMVQELSANAQFITTTFRPELVGVGEKHYGGESKARAQMHRRHDAHPRPRSPLQRPESLVPPAHQPGRCLPVRRGLVGAIIAHVSVVAIVIHPLYRLGTPKASQAGFAHLLGRHLWRTVFLIRLFATVCRLLSLCTGLGIGGRLLRRNAQRLLLCPPLCLCPHPRNLLHVGRSGCLAALLPGHVCPAGHLRFANRPAVFLADPICCR